MTVAWLGSLPLDVPRPAPAMTGSGLEAVVPVLVVALGVVLVILTAAILAKSFLEARRDRQRAAVREAVRADFFRLLGDTDPDWNALVDSLSDREREVLVDELERSTDLLSGGKTTQLQELAETLELRTAAIRAVETGPRHRRLWGLKLFIAFEWECDPEWLLGAVSADRDEGEAAIRVLANAPDRISRTAGVELALRYDGLSVYGMHGLSLLLRKDPAPLLEQLDRRDVDDPVLLEQLLRVLARAETLTGDAPMNGVLDCLDHETAGVRRAACTVLSDYGWRSDVRDQVDLGTTALFTDPSPAVRRSAYEMLGTWKDAAARAKLAHAVAAETDPRALFTIARELEGDANRYLDDDAGARLERYLSDLEALSDLGRHSSPRFA